MSHIIGVVVLIWVAWTYDIWTAIGFFVLYMICVFGLLIGLRVIAEWSLWRWIAEWWERQEGRWLWLYFAALLAAAMVSAVVSATRAEPVTTLPKPTHYILPPLEYDYPYQGKVVVTRVDTIEQLIQDCHTTKRWLLGCSIVRQNGTCDIILVKDEVIVRWGWTYELMMRHEVGHCNGWGGDHAGQRARWEPAGKAPAVKTSREAPPTVNPTYKVYPTEKNQSRFFNR